MTKIHLIEKQNLIELVDAAAQEYSSGYWSISAMTAREMVGGQIYFHREQAARSFFGGRILGFTVQNEGTFIGRIVFRFHADASCRGVLAMANWSVEMALDRTTS